MDIDGLHTHVIIYKFAEQYAQPMSGNVNRKLFKSWLKRNRSNFRKYQAEYYYRRTYFVSNENALLNIDVMLGDIVMCNDTNKAFINITGYNGLTSDWSEIKRVNTTDDDSMMVIAHNSEFQEVSDAISLSLVEVCGIPERYLGKASE